MFEPSQIPGMIEPGEQALLEGLAAEVGDRGAIVEFGCFFGRSTACLANGAARWWSPGRPPAIVAYDSFACADGPGFARHVLGIARRFGVADRVEREGGRVDFLPVYRHFLQPAEQAGLVRTVRAELRDAAWDGGPIGLMHVDAPKFYAEMKYVLVRFFPHLTVGGAVVFQDLLYHWSAGLIASAQLLAEAGIVSFERTVATSAVARVLRTPTPADILELDMAMSAEAVPAAIDRMRAALAGLQVDRPQVYLPRLHLAKMQHLWEQGLYPEARQAFADMVADSGGRFGPMVARDFQELLGHGFSLRALTDLDH